MSEITGRSVLSHVPQMRFAAGRRITQQVWMLLSFLWTRLRGNFLALLFLTVAARGLSILALAGTIKIGAVVLLHWTRAIAIAATIGIDLTGVTKWDVARIGAGMIVVLYALVAICGNLRLRSRTRLAGRTAERLCEHLLMSPKLGELVRIPDFQTRLKNGLASYTKSARVAVDMLANALLSLAIVLVLTLMEPVVIVFLAILIVPTLVFYLLTGRHVGHGSRSLAVVEARRRQLLRNLTSRAANRPGVELNEAMRDEFFELSERTIKRKGELSGSSATPNTISTMVTGLVLAGAVLYFSTLEVESGSLIFLLIGLILIRFLLTYAQAILMGMQGLMQRLDDIRFVNDVIIAGRIPEDGLPEIAAVDDENGDDEGGDGLL